MASIITVKVRDKGNKSLEYKNKIMLDDFKQLACLFSDLELHGARIEKSFEEFKRNKGRQGFPW